MPEVPESHADLLDAKFATLATVGADGRPQMTEVWFLHDDGDLKISLNGSRQKTKNLRQNPAVSLLVLDLANPFRYLEVRGDATVAPDDDYAFADRVGAKYGTDLRVHDGTGDHRVVVTIEPTHVHTLDMSS